MAGCAISVFRDEKNPRISVTTKETILDDGQPENRIYRIAFESLADLNGFMDFTWKGKAENPALVPVPHDF